MPRAKWDPLITGPDLAQLATSATGEVTLPSGLVVNYVGAKPERLANGAVAVTSKSPERPAGLRVALPRSSDHPGNMWVLQVAKTHPEVDSTFPAVALGVKFPGVPLVQFPIDKYLPPSKRSKFHVLISEADGQVTLQLLSPKDSRPLLGQPATGSGGLELIEFDVFGRDEAAFAGVAVESVLPAGVDDEFLAAVRVPSRAEDVVDQLFREIAAKAKFADDIQFAKPAVAERSDAPLIA